MTINLQTAMTEYNKAAHPGKVFQDQNNRKIGVDSQVYDNTTFSGEQVYAVVDDRSIPGEDVKEVTVLFKGSTSPTDFLKDPVDVVNDWLFNDLPMAKNIFFMNDSGNPFYNKAASPQLKASSRELNAIMETYPNAKIKLSGHSLGGMNAQYAVSNIKDKKALKRINSVHIYNSPDIYPTLTKEQNKTAYSIKSKIIVYADPKDSISMVGRKGKTGSDDSVGNVYYTDSKDIGVIDQHMTYGYKLENGQIKVIDTDLPLEVKNPRKAMGAFYKDKKKFQKSGKGLNSHEKIFLDAEQATVISSGLVSTAQTAYDEIKSSADKANEEAEELFNTTLEMPFGVTELNETELAEAYEIGQVTKESIVTKTAEYFKEKVSHAGEQVTAYTNLKNDIEKGIASMLEKDSELAGDFKEWES